MRRSSGGLRDGVAHAIVPMHRSDGGVWRVLPLGAHELLVCRRSFRTRTRDCRGRLVIPWDTAVLLPMDWQKEAMLVAPLTCHALRRTGGAAAGREGRRDVNDVPWYTCGREPSMGTSVRTAGTETATPPWGTPCTE